MNKKKKIIIPSLTLLIACFCCNAYATSCQEYEYGDGIIVQGTEDGGTKILATSSAGVSFDDVDSIKDARDEATMEAKALLSKFLTEDIMSDEKINQIVNESSKFSNNERTATKSVLKERVKSLRNSSRALLRGVAPLGSCYTKAREVRVTVGLKSGTIKAAGKIAEDISTSVVSQPTPSSVKTKNTPRIEATTNNRATSGNDSTSFREMEGYSDSEQIKNF